VKIAVNDWKAMFGAYWTAKSNPAAKSLPTFLTMPVCSAKNRASIFRKYASGWTVTPVKYPHYTSVVIHNTMPGLPHLLEHGHALVRGGRKVGTVDGREHIAPVEEQLVEQYEREVLSAL
jgi:hypothetical protein